MISEYKLLVLLCFSMVSALTCVAQEYDNIKQLIPEQLELADSLANDFYIQAKAADVDQNIARGVHLLGLTNYFKGNLYLSSSYYREALSRDYTNGDAKLQESCWNNLGINFELQNNLPASLEAYQKSFALAEARGDEKGMAETRINFGLLEIKRQNTDSGIAYLEEALAFFESVQDTLNAGLCLQNIGVGYKYKGDFTRAIDFSQKAMDKFTALNYVFGTIDALVNLGHNTRSQGNDPLAKVYLEQARKLSVLYGFPFKEAVALNNLAELDISEGNYVEARRKIEYALEVFKQQGNYDQWESTFLELLHIAVLEGNSSRYEFLMDSFQNASRLRVSSESLARYDELKAVYEMEEKVRQIKYQQEEIQANRRKIFFLVVSLVIALGGSIVIGFLLLRTRFLMKELFRKNEAILQRWPVVDRQAENQDLSSFDDKLWQLFRDIDTAIDRQELYRDRNLNVAALSRKFASNDTYVSKAINTYSHLNFNSYINHYRILAAQKMLTSKGKILSLQEIGEQCGFNSYTTFVRLFKQQTGLTPSQYLAQAKSNKKL